MMRLDRLQTRLNDSAERLVLCPSAAPTAISLAHHEVDTCSWTTGNTVGQY